MIWDYQNLLSRRLLIWSLANILGGIWLSVTQNGVWQAFGFMGLLWGAVVGVISLFGIQRANKRLNEHVDLMEVERESSSLRRSLRLNAVMDLIYILGGTALLLFHGSRGEFTTGSAWAIIFQGIFLFFIDVLHALNVPEEYVIPDLGILEGAEHQADTMEGGKGAVLLVHGFPGTPAELRGLGQSLQTRGWTVRLMRLPGHGSGYRSLLQTRAPEWEQAVAEELAVLQVMHQPVLLAGYSLGAGLSIPVAVNRKPDGLILLAPFWIPEPLGSRALISVLRPLLPVAVNPFKSMRINILQFRMAVEDIIPDFDFSAPHIQAAMNGFRLPLIFVQQFLLMSRRAREYALKLPNIPVLVVQAREDQIVRKSATQKLIERMRVKPRLIEVPGDHNLNLPKHPGFIEMEQAVLDFADEFSVG